jgi:GT2 family glycosyltransferase
MFKSKVLEATGGMNKEYIGTEDFEFVLRCAQKGFVIGNLQMPLYFYRTNETQRSSRFHSS